jgi:Sugar (and other) transporter
MEGYDTSLIGSLFTYPTFTKKYDGELTPAGKYEPPAAWQTALMNGSAVGSIFGLIANGFLCDGFGYLKTMMGTLSLVTAAIFIPNIEFLFGWPGHFGSSLGYVPNACDIVCFRSLSNSTMWLPHNLRQHLLGHWPDPCRWRPPRPTEPPERVAISYSFCSSMALPRSDTNRDPFRTKIPLVAGSTWPLRRRKKSYASPNCQDRR